MPTMASNGLPTVASPDSNYEENGRVYHGYRKGMYMFPCDEDEKDRMDIYHKLFEVARKSVLHSAPLHYNSHPEREPTRILDIGCGTGIWAIDMAEYQNAEVVGTDLVNIQPDKIPPNLRFRVPRDYESIWGLGEGSWDLIHLQMQCGAVSSWPDLYQKIFTHLKPGSGHIEQIEIDMEPRCKDGTLPQDSVLKQWYNYLVDATSRNYRSIEYKHNTREMLVNAGFIDVQEQVIIAPLNGWPTDPHQRSIGQWYNLGLSEGLEALSLAPFYRMFKWDANEHIRPLVREVSKEISKSKIHAYNEIHIWTARRPS